MYKYAMVTLFAAASILGVWGLITYEPEGYVEPPAANELRLVATNYQFDQTEYKVKSGETMVIKLMNKGGIHGAEIVGLDINLAGDAMETEHTFDQPGSYEIICSIPCGEGHQEMKATLIVE